jgi:hypothetical protein
VTDEVIDAIDRGLYSRLSNSEIRHDFWRPDADVRHVEIVGKKWPIVIVDLFEVNQIGERRYVATRSYDFNERDQK